MNVHDMLMRVESQEWSVCGTFDEDDVDVTPRFIVVAGESLESLSNVVPHTVRCTFHVVFSDMSHVAVQSATRHSGKNFFFKNKLSHKWQQRHRQQGQRLSGRSRRSRY
jgi:hypothetical protein